MYTPRPDHMRQIESRYPKTIEEVLDDIEYKKQVSEHTDVQITIMQELMQDIGRRIIALEAIRHD